MDKAKSYMGIARKAGALITGEENSGIAVRAGKAKLLIVASDASDNAQRRAEGFVKAIKLPLVRVPYTKDNIAEATGCSGCSMAVFTDIGLASSFMQALCDKTGEYAETAELLRSKNEKALIRKKEAQAHDKNKRTGKGRMKV